jgi:hypothetical protein
VTDSGSQTTTLAVTSNSDPGGKSTATLTCTAGHPMIAVDKPALAFGDQLVPVPAMQTFTVSNPGTGPLTIASITRSGANAADYAIAPACAPCTIAATGMQTFTVTFTPAAPGNADIQIAIANNSPDAGANPTTIAVTGNGIAPQINAPVAISFNPVELGGTDSQQVMVSNLGTAPLAISSATITADAAEFTITQAGATALAAGASTSWTIQCKPNAPPGPRTGTSATRSHARPPTSR